MKRDRRTRIANFYECFFVVLVHRSPLIVHRSSFTVKRSTNLLSTEFRRELKRDVACFTRDCTVPTTISVDIYENL